VVASFWQRSPKELAKSREHDSVATVGDEAITDDFIQVSTWVGIFLYTIPIVIIIYFISRNILSRFQ